MPDPPLNLGFEEPSAAYASPSQRARVFTESWVASYLFCPNCGAARMTQQPNNSPVADFYCGECREAFELKGGAGMSGFGVDDSSIVTLSNCPSQPLLERSMDEMDLTGASAEELARLEAEIFERQPYGTRDTLGRFLKGNPGRRKGSRNRMTHRLAMALLDDFTCYEMENIERLRRWFFPEYVKLMGRFIPREAAPARPDFADYGPEETARVAAAARAALERVERGEAGLEALMAALETDPGP